MSTQKKRGMTSQESAEYVLGAEVLRILQIKPQTLYAYVSRGLIRRITIPGQKENLYSRSDIKRLQARKAARMGHGAVAADSMFAGAPIVNSSITELTPAGPRYRGRDATDLIHHPGQFESVAELLWTGFLHEEPLRWNVHPLPKAMQAVTSALRSGQPSVGALRSMAAVTVSAGESIKDELRSGNTTKLARQLIAAYAGCLGMQGPKKRFVPPRADATVAEAILVSLTGSRKESCLSAVNATLIMCADHELSAATFAARVCASADAGLHDCMMTALATHAGDQLGGGCVRVEDMLHKFGSERSLARNVKQILRSGMRIPGFNHPIYPDGDPRSPLLIDIAKELQRRGSRRNPAIDLANIVAGESGQLPNIEVALVAMTMAMQLPPYTACGIWALGRSAGWIAHVMEQRLTGVMLRPRARYGIASIASR